MRDVILEDLVIDVDGDAAIADDSCAAQSEGVLACMCHAIGQANVPPTSTSRAFLQDCNSINFASFIVRNIITKHCMFILLLNTLAYCETEMVHQKRCRPGFCYVREGSSDETVLKQRIGGIVFVAIILLLSKG